VGDNASRAYRNISVMPDSTSPPENSNMITKRLVKYSIFYLLLLASLSILRFFAAKSSHYNDMVIDPVEIAL